MVEITPCHQADAVALDAAIDACAFAGTLQNLPQLCQWLGRSADLELRKKMRLVVDVGCCVWKHWKPMETPQNHQRWTMTMIAMMDL